MQAFLNVLDQCPKIELDVPLVKSYLAQFAARAIIAELVSVAELAHPLENGTHFPLFLLCLQQTAKLKDREWLTDLFQQSKVNMQKMLPGTLCLSPTCCSQRRRRHTTDNILTNPHSSALIQLGP